MSRPLFVYVHGFNSSPQSVKARLLGAYLANNPIADYKVPELSHWPAEAMRDLEHLVESNYDREVVLIGSSLGGFYSLWLTEKYVHCRSVLVNPAITPYRLLEEWLGENENLYTHDKYELTPEHLEQLKALTVNTLKDPDKYLLLVQTADETLDYREAVDFLSSSPRFVQPGGSHGFDQFQNLFPAIVQFSRHIIELPAATPLPSLSE